MSRAVASKGKKKGGVSFTIDCSKPVDDKIMEIASLISFREVFFHTEIEGWQLSIVSVLDVLDITLSQSSQSTVSGLPMFHQTMLSSTSKPIPVAQLSHR
ncbi:unnamed protein product, partial [Brassica oleracea var. botrytis]